MNIYLIGFMGCGKSFTAQHLAKRLGIDWLDLDERIEAKAGQSISELFAQKGEAHFRTLEAETLRETANHSSVIATGGGTPCFHQNMDWMNQQGKTIYLKAPSWFLQQRLAQQTENRPLIAGKSRTELLTFIDQKLAEREAFYSRATMIYFLQQNEQKNLKDLLAYFE